MWFSDEAKAKVHNLRKLGRRLYGLRITLNMLWEKENMKKSKMQVILPHTILIYIREIAFWVWEKIDVDSKFKGSFTKPYQGVTEPFAQFIYKLSKAVRR